MDNDTNTVWQFSDTQINIYANYTTNQPTNQPIPCTHKYAFITFFWTFVGLKIFIMTNFRISC
jgi:hypothetical protein